MADLCAPILLHVAIGLGLALLIWTIGFGLMAYRLPIASLTSARGTFAYPVGVLVVVGVAFLADAAPVAGAAIALLVLTTALSKLRRCTGPFRVFGATVTRTLLLASPALLVLAFLLGAVWHGPSATRGSIGNKDFLWYIARAISARRSVWPFHNLAIAGNSGRLVEAGPELISGALAWLPGFDAFLFFGVSLPILVFASFVVGLKLLQPRHPVEIRGNRVVMLLICVVLIDAIVVNSPSYLVDSPPVALLLPAVFALGALLWGPSMRTGRLTAATVVLTLVCIETKVVGLLAVALVVASSSLRARAGLRSLATVTAVPITIAALGLLELAHSSSWQLHYFATPAFRPGNLISELTTGTRPLGGPRWWHDSATGITTLGSLMIGAGMLVRRRAGLAAGVALATLLTWSIIRWELYVLQLLALCLAGLCIWRQGPRSAWPPAIAAGALLIATAAPFWDFDLSNRTALAVVASMAAAMYAALAGAILDPRAAAMHAIGGLVVATSLAVLAISGALVLAPFLAGGFGIVLSTLSTDRKMRAVRIAVVAFAIAGCAGVAARAVARDHFHLYTQRVDVTPDDYRVWRKVASLTPHDSLIFTDFGGNPREDFLYPATAGRQLFLAGWVYSPLWLDDAELARRLALNANVLTGRRQPESLRGLGSFSAYFAVVARRRRMPPARQLIYENARWALYRLR